MDRLEAVRQVMLGAGQSRISALDTGGTSFIADAENYLNKHMVEVQAMPWHYNTKINVDLTTDGSGVATIPTGTTTIDTAGGSAHIDATPLGGRLYDRENNTDNLGENSTVRVEYTLAYQWGCIPIPVQIYIVKCAIIDMILHVGRQDLLRNAYADREKAYIRATQSDTLMADHNFVTGGDSRMLLGRQDQIRRFHVPGRNF